jgi:hypothetical protein
MIPAPGAQMPSHEDRSPCPMPSDCAKDINMVGMACFANCATVLGIVADFLVIPTVAVAQPVQLPAGRALLSLHGPPEPHPPKRLS